MTVKENLTKELDAMLAQAMKQPGVAEVMAVYAQSRPASESAEEARQSLKAQWVYQSTNATT